MVTLALVAGIILYAASRYQSGLPGPLGEAMLVELNDRLQVQGVVPPLPERLAFPVGGPVRRRGEVRR